MPIAPKKAETRIRKALSAWETLRPAKSFAGMDLDGFKAKIQPSLEIRDQIASLESQLIAAKNRRDEADKTALATIQIVVNSVKGDPEEGEDGDLYEAMGYIRKSERKSGLRRGSRSAGTD